MSVHTPLTAETRGMIDAAFFAAMKPGAYFVNTARGAIVNVADLHRALDAGTLRGRRSTCCRRSPWRATRRCSRIRARS